MQNKITNALVSINILMLILLIICLAVFSERVEDRFNQISLEYKTSDNANNNQVIIIKEGTPTGNIEIFICPYCNNKLSIFSSSYITSVAQFRCNFCGYKSPEVNINKTDAEKECIEKLKENFKSGIWSLHTV